MDHAASSGSGDNLNGGPSESISAFLEKTAADNNGKKKKPNGKKK